MASRLEWIVTRPPDRIHPVAAASQWVSRIIAVSVEMVAPGIGGHWLDRKLGTGFLALIGFAIGITLGMLHLLVMTGSFRPRKTKDQETDLPDGKDPPQ